MSDLDQQLLDACKNGDIETVKKTIGLGADLTKRGEDYYTPLQFAILNEHRDVATLILDKGPAALGEYGITALSCAFGKGLKLIEIAELIIEKGVDVNSKHGFTESTFLYGAVLDDHIETVKLLLRKNADPDITNKNGETPFEQACKLNRKQIAEALISNGADVHRKTKEGLSPMHWAARYGYTDIVKKLLEKKVDVDVKDDSDQTSLHYAAMKGQLEVAKILIANGAEINAASKGSTPLYEAEQYNQVEMAEFLTQNGGKKLG